MQLGMKDLPSVNDSDVLKYGKFEVNERLTGS
jgi:hypothetical protein